MDIIKKEYAELEFFQKYCEKYPGKDIFHFLNFLDKNNEGYHKEVQFYMDSDYYDIDNDNFDSYKNINNMNMWKNLYDSSLEEIPMPIIDDWAKDYMENKGYVKKREKIKQYDKVFYVHELESFIELKYKHKNLISYKNQKEIEHPNFNLLDVAVLLKMKQYNKNNKELREVLQECEKDNKHYFIENNKKILKDEEMKDIYYFSESGLELKALKNIYLTTKIDPLDKNLSWFKYAKEKNKENFDTQGFKDIWCLNFLEAYSDANGYKKHNELFKELVDITKEVGLIDEIKQYIPEKLLERNKYLIDLSDNVIILKPKVYDKKLMDRSFIEESIEMLSYLYVMKSYEEIKDSKPKYYTSRLHEDVNKVDIIYNEKDYSFFINNPNKEMKKDLFIGLEKLLPVLLEIREIKNNSDKKEKLYESSKIIIEYIALQKTMGSNIDGKEMSNKKTLKI